MVSDDKDVYIMGDFNIGLLKCETSQVSQDFLLSLIPTVDKPTRVHIVQPYGVKKYMNCALWGKSIKLGTVKAQVVTIIFSYGPHPNMRRGRGTVYPRGGGIMAVLVLVILKTQRRVQMG